MRQASMIRNAREYVNPRDWDEGVSAALLKYDANVCCTGASAGTGYKQFGAGVSGGIAAYGGVACRLLERANRELAIERARKRQTWAFVACHIPLIEVIRLFRCREYSGRDRRTASS
ncbi:FimD/PapC N-terminal domain-containing protein [Burkholderia stagnalis]|uniref:FimD/PapC N-terminal domain-containing protein n=2 Tax=Burkholderia stagnalis TaxID=1503054 RepID=UPI000AA8239E